jgi:hypothetical protein
MQLEEIHMLEAEKQHIEMNASGKLPTLLNADNVSAGEMTVALTDKVAQFGIQAKRKALKREAVLAERERLWMRMKSGSEVTKFDFGHKQKRAR